MTCQLHAAAADKRSRVCRECRVENSGRTSDRNQPEVSNRLHGGPLLAIYSRLGTDDKETWNW